MGPSRRLRIRLGFAAETGVDDVLGDQLGDEGRLLHGLSPVSLLTVSTRVRTRATDYAEVHACFNVAGAERDGGVTSRNGNDPHIGAPRFERYAATLDVLRQAAR